MLLATGCVESTPGWGDDASGEDSEEDSGSDSDDGLNDSSSASDDVSDGSGTGIGTDSGDTGNSSGDGGSGDTGTTTDPTNTCILETCNGVDDDCDGLIDEVSAANTDCGSCRLEQFMNRAYWFCEEAISWDEARDACRALGSELAVIEDANHDGFIATAQPDNGGNFADDFWIGLHDRNTEGSYEWVDGTPVSYVNWASGEPNNQNGDEDCGEFFSRVASKWNDDVCSKTEFYVCSSLHTE